MNRDHYILIRSVSGYKVAEYYKERGIEEKSPHTDLKIGDLVNFTNDQGCVFHDHIIIGFEPVESRADNQGRCVFSAQQGIQGAYWFAKRPNQFSKPKANVLSKILRGY